VLSTSFTLIFSRILDKNRKMKTKKNKKTSSQINKSPLYASLPTILESVKIGSQKAQGMIYVLGKEDKKKISSLIRQKGLSWQKKSLENSNREVLQFISTKGPVWILCPRNKNVSVSHFGRLEESPYAWMRDQMGSLCGLVKAYQIESLHIELHETDHEQELGLWVGLELAQYSYKQAIDGQQSFPKVSVKKIKGIFAKETIKEAKALAAAVNLSRHLVNIPPNLLNPSTVSEYIRKNFSQRKNLQLEIWDEERLAKENMNLHLAVGSGSDNPPCMIHLKYRPTKSVSKKPIAFVGKGITFDSGGLDIKPSSGMRLMKKDMGGAAAVLGLAMWASETEYPRDMDFYLALAENSVDAKSFRPSDVFTARNGMKVEIHNTDAEGRLVLADVMDVAVTQKGKDEPAMIIDIATLTGAIKVALGADIAGLFSNHDGLAEELNMAGFQRGDLNWRMPLFGKYTASFSSPFADMVNAVDGFGGAITAALFLEKFTRQKPWAHLDIYAWADKASGALASSGGSGQAVQALVRFIQASDF
jgi:leucyl aminopeptidase